MKKVLTLSIFLLSVIFTFAQSEQQTGEPVFVQLTLNDGSVKRGELIENNAEFFLLLIDPIGEVQIPKYSIAEIEYVNKATALGQWDFTELAYANQYYLTCSAIPNKKGEASLRLTFAGLSYSHAVTDNLSITGSTSWIGAPLVANIRLSQSFAPKVHGSIGITVGTLGFYNLSAGGFMPNARITLGDRANNFSAGYGVAWVQGDDDPGMANVWTAGTSLRLSEKFSFVAELIYVFEAERADSYSGEKNFGVNILGVRWHNKPGSMWQIGFAGAFETYDYRDYEYDYNTGEYTYSGTERVTEWVPIPVPTVSWTKSF